MSRFAIAVIAAAALAGPSLCIAADRSTGSGARTSSFVPRHTNRHVYGAPIQPPIAGRTRTTHHKHAPKKQWAIR